MFTPIAPRRHLDEHLLVSAMARALAPFQNVDLKGFAELVLMNEGFSGEDIARCWRAAVSAVLAKRAAFSEARASGWALPRARRQSAEEAQA